MSKSFEVLLKIREIIDDQDDDENVFRCFLEILWIIGEEIIVDADSRAMALRVLPSFPDSD